MNNKVQNILLGVLAVGLIGLTVAYAALSQTLNITGTAKVSAQNWDVHFENLSAGNVTGYAELDATASKFAIKSDDTTILSGNLGTLKAPGDSISYTFDITNDGDINAILDSITLGTPTCSSTTQSVADAVCNDLTYTLTYTDGTAIAKGDKLAASAIKNATITITYKTTATSIASEDVSVDALDAVFTYVQDAK